MKSPENDQDENNDESDVCTTGNNILKNTT